MSKTESIKYYNRYTQAIEEEAVFGEKWLRWAYENPLGLLTTRAFASRRFVSAWYGRRMKSPNTKGKIEAFIKEYGVDPSEFEKGVDDFESFNDFFIRRLRPESRPLDNNTDHVIFPADGRHLVFPDLTRVDRVFIKGQRWSLTELFGENKEWIDKFRGGSLVLSRLCPLDYHHFHFPLAGVPELSKIIKGPLYSVNPIALRKDLGFLMGNLRSITPISETLAGSVSMLEIGATMVGSIHQNYRDGKPVMKGDRKGYFEFGGSSVITVFQRGKIQFADDLVEQSKAGIELYAKMGDFMGTIHK